MNKFRTLSTFGRAIPALLIPLFAGVACEDADEGEGTTSDEVVTAGGGSGTEGGAGTAAGTTDSAGTGGASSATSSDDVAGTAGEQADPSTPDVSEPDNSSGAGGAAVTDTIDKPGDGGSDAASDGGAAGGENDGDMGGAGSDMEAGGASAAEMGGAAGEGGDSTAIEALDFAPGEICAKTDRVGTFQFYLGGDRTIFSGTVTTGVAPAAISAVLDEEGTCKLLGPRSLFCDTACDSGTTCAGDNVCVDTPVNVVVGALSVTGASEDLEINSNGITKVYSKSISDPYPGFEAGAAIELTADGGEAYEAFSLSAFGVAPMVSSLEFLPVSRDTDAVLTWDAAGADADQAGVYVTVTVNAHGGTTGWIECEAPDTGEFAIPANLINQLMDLGLSGFPRAELGRRSTDGVRLPQGCVDFRIASKVTVEIEVDGLTSCNTDDDCSDGQTCSVELACGDPE